MQGLKLSLIYPINTILWKEIYIFTLTNESSWVKRCCLVCLVVLCALLCVMCYNACDACDPLHCGWRYFGVDMCEEQMGCDRQFSEVDCCCYHVICCMDMHILFYSNFRKLKENMLLFFFFSKILYYTLWSPPCTYISESLKNILIKSLESIMVNNFSPEDR